MKFLRVRSEFCEIPKIPPGVQLYTVRYEFEKNFFGTLKKVAEMGYKVVEFHNRSYKGIPASEINQALNKLGLKTVSTYIFSEDLMNDMQNQIEYAKAIGARYIVMAFPKERFDDEASLNATIAALKNIGQRIKRNGLQLLYHPHAVEYELRNGKFLIDRLLEAVGPDLMQLEIDLYWVKKAGLDPKTTLLAHKGIVPLIHLKDMDRNGDSTEVGSGVIDWIPIFCILKNVGVKYYFVENETPDPLESIKTSLHYLKSIGVV